jgi:hypothetical protein
VKKFLQSPYLSILVENWSFTLFRITQCFTEFINNGSRIHIMSLYNVTMRIKRKRKRKKENWCNAQRTKSSTGLSLDKIFRAKRCDNVTCAVNLALVASQLVQWQIYKCPISRGGFKLVTDGFSHIKDVKLYNIIESNHYISCVVIRFLIKAFWREKPLTLIVIALIDSLPWFTS